MNFKILRKLLYFFLSLKKIVINAVFKLEITNFKLN